MDRQSLRRQIVVYVIDLLIACVIFFFSRYIEEGVLPRWYWLVATAATWSLIGILSRKLAFERFKRVRNALTGILVMDIITYVVIFILWMVAFPERDITFHQLWPLPFLILGEFLFYSFYRVFVIRKLPYFYEEIVASDSAEKDIEEGIKLEEFKEDNSAAEAKIDLSPDISRIHDAISHMTWEEGYEWINSHKDEFQPDTLVLDSTDPEDVIADDMKDPRMILALHTFNDTRHLNTFLSFSNYKLAPGGALSLHGTTAGLRKEKMLKGNPFPLNYLIYFLDYIWSRVCPKLSGTRWLYMLLTEAQDRSLPRVELLGRIARAGFTIIDDEVRQGEYYVTAVKTSKPIRVGKPSYGPLIRLQRVGYNGEMIGVYKFRTMYAYSEFLQSYAYDRVGLQDGGKLKDDFRVNSWGKFLRRFWLDELPMILNLIGGDLKLVGVRPLSKHYFSLYTPEMQKLRTTVKPGLFPPFYYEKVRPKTIEDVQASERRYIEAYKKAPFRTDCRYFFGAIWNIVFRRARSN